MSIHATAFGISKLSAEHAIRIVMASCRTILALLLHPTKAKQLIAHIPKQNQCKAQTISAPSPIPKISQPNSNRPEQLCHVLCCHVALKSKRHAKLSPTVILCTDPICCLMLEKNMSICIALLLSVCDQSHACAQLCSRHRPCDKLVLLPTYFRSVVYTCWRSSSCASLESSS
jgi:hypothetical protein